jgi:cysteine-rich repeat protein
VLGSRAPAFWGVAIIHALAACGNHPGEPPLVATSEQALLPSSSISSSFNSTAIPAGRTIWFTSVVKVTGVGTTPVHIYFNRSHIQFTASSVSYDLPTPDAVLTIDPAATSASTTFDTATSIWRTTVPKTFSGNAFIGALAYPVTINLPGSISPVVWTASFQSDAAVNVTWKWSAAVYSQLSSDMNQLGVKPVDDNRASQYRNADPAGTPESFKTNVVAGGKGNGGSNYTGTLTSGLTFVPPQPCANVVCPAPSQCELTNSCEPTTGLCTAVPRQNGTSCDDGDACTRTDTCQQGSCTGANPVVCTQSDQCHVAGTCDPSSGVCSNPIAANGSACNDGDACTQSDACQEGSCTGANPVTCSASDQCHAAGTCDPSSGACSNPPLADGTPCFDGDLCTQTDRCESGICLGADPVTCTAIDQCHAAGACDPSSGICSNPVQNCCGDGGLGGAEACDDGNLTSDDGCASDCTMEEGYACSGSPSACSTVCGDGICAGGETVSACANDCMLHVETVTAGWHYSCALLEGGTVRCWGESWLGQLGIERTEYNGELGDQLPRVKLGSGRTAVALSGGGTHTCALLDDGSVKCWGDNSRGQLGVEDSFPRGDLSRTMGDALPPVDLGTGRTAVAIAAGSGHTCAILDNGAVKCWGGNYAGVLGLGDRFPRGRRPGELGDSLPVVPLGTGRTAVALATGGAHTCAILDDGAVKCWGANYYGQLGLGDADDRGDGPDEMGDRLPPVDLGTGRRALSISTGSSHTCAVLDDSTVKCWGANWEGRLGLGDENHRGDGPGEMGDALPRVDLGAGRTALAVRVAGFRSCAVLDNGALKCWGENRFGELGLGHTRSLGDQSGEMGDALPAVDLGTGRSVRDVATGSQHSCAVLDDGSLKCWGDNWAFALGLDGNDRGDGPGEMGDALPRVQVGSRQSCGDHVVSGAEICDDGNANSGDGCFACTMEEGFVCAGSPSDCSPVCGDGIVAAYESCDDGNTISRDGCSAECGPEPDIALTAVHAERDFSDPYRDVFVVTVTACNYGTDWGAGYVSFRLSPDSSIDLSDREWVFDDVGYAALSPGACSTATSELPASNPESPPFDETYTIGAIFDPRGRAPDIDRSNNAIAGNQVSIGADLAVSDFTAELVWLDAPYYSLSYTVCNYGTVRSASSRISLRLSTDSLIDVADPPWDESLDNSLWAPSLRAGECQTEDSGLLMPVPASFFGTYSAGLIIDPDAELGDLDRSNNMAAGNQVTIGPDLAVSNVSAVPVPDSDYFDVYFTLCNLGNVVSGNEVVSLRLSADETIDASDPRWDPSLDFEWYPIIPGQCETRRYWVQANPWNAPRTFAGTYTFGVILDPDELVPDVERSNNAAAGNQVAIGPDLSASDLIATLVTYDGYTYFQVTLMICNLGTDVSEVPLVSLRLSADQAIELSDPRWQPPELETSWSSEVYPGQCQTGWGIAEVYDPLGIGTYTAGVILDPDGLQNDLNRSNNTVAGNQVTMP